MIKIQEHIGGADVQSHFDQLVVDLWNFLNPLNANGDNYKNISIIHQCEKLIKEIDEDNGRYRKRLKCKAAESRMHRRFFKMLLNDNHHVLKQLISAEPAHFDALILDVFAILPANYFYSEVRGKIVQTQFGKQCSQLFNYKRFRKSEFCKSMVSKLDLQNATCPYCNWDDLEIITLNNQENRKTLQRAYLDFDHFYSQSRFPFLSVSFYNLIPTCRKCNSTDKGDKLFTIRTHVHPYHEAFHDIYRFSLSPQAHLDFDDAHITINSMGVKVDDITLNDLKLQERYESGRTKLFDFAMLFLNNVHLIGTPLEDHFYDMIYGLDRAPRDRSEILRVKQGKAKLDILIELDFNRQIPEL